MIQEIFTESKVVIVTPDRSEKYQSVINRFKQNGITGTWRERMPISDIEEKKELLREDLITLKQRKHDAIEILSSISGIEEEKIEKFISGEDSLDYTEIIALTALKG